MKFQFDPALSRSLGKRSREGRVAGVKATGKALAAGLLEKVYVAGNAEKRVIKGLLSLCEETGTEVVYFPTMKELGEFCCLRVGTAACGILKAPAKTE